MNVNAGTGLRSWAPVRSLEALRALSDGQRHRILTLLMEAPLTATELAKKLRIGRTRLYYHLGILEEHGLIQIADTRVVSGIIERRYRATATSFRVDRGLLGSTASAEQITDAQAAILDAAAADLHASAALQDDSLLVSRAFLRLNPVRRKQLRDRLGKLLHEYREPDTDGADVEFTTALFRIEGNTQ